MLAILDFPRNRGIIIVYTSICNLGEDEVLVVKGTVRTWGNSLAVRIPKIVSEDLGIEENTVINMAVDDGLLVITPVSGRKRRLQKMLKQITPENLPDLREPFGQSVGREAL